MIVRRGHLRPLMAAVAVACVLAAAACGGSSGGSSSSTPPPTTTSESTSTATSSGGVVSAAAGKTVFTSNCATCHTLADAGASGTVGPNLDKLKPGKATVQRQVTNGGSVMPAFGGRLSESQIKSVALYVSSVAGKGGSGGSGGGTP